MKYVVLRVLLYTERENVSVHHQAELSQVYEALAERFGAVCVLWVIRAGFDRCRSHE